MAKSYHIDENMQRSFKSENDAAVYQSKIRSDTYSLKILYFTIPVTTKATVIRPHFIQST